MVPDWPAWLWLLYAVGLVYFGLFVAYFLHFRRLARDARSGDPAAVARHDRAIRGFPNGFFAKMLGLHPLAPPREAGEQVERPAGPERPG
ncbi:MAG TPA: hypothetical protein VFH47_07580 [Candidatus Thermoplasmatota archaeon]|nr:hypothetical protein [Candidatus Thermoplasmatota archaeon]